MVSACPRGARKMAMTTASVDFEDVCERSDRWLPEVDRKAVADCMEAALLHLNALAVEAASAGVFCGISHRSDTWLHI